MSWCAAVTTSSRGCSSMSEEFHDAVSAAVKRHSSDIDADDLRSAAAALENIATQWEVVDDAL